MSIRTWKFRYILALSAFALACGDSNQPAPMNGADAGADEPNPATHPCLQHTCEGAARCEVDQASLASCVCMPGYAGASCDACAAGFAASEGQCHRQLELHLPEPAGANCASGGLASSTGLDVNGSGALEAGEIAETTYVCASAPAASDACTPDPCGDHGVCAAVTGGGFTCSCEDGYRGAVCDQCAVGYQRSSDDAPCELGSEIDDPIAQPASDGCPEGAYVIHHGVDLDGNGTLEDQEIQSRRNVCKRSRTGNFTFSNKASLFEFADVTDIYGNVTISSAHLTDLAQLSSLIRIEGNLTISNNQELERVDGLARLDTITGNLVVSHNPALSELDLGSRVVRGNVTISSNAELSEIAMAQLQVVGGDLSLSYHPKLTGPLGWSALMAVGGDVLIEENDALASLAGLGSLEDTGSFIVRENEVLTSIEGLDALETVRGNLDLVDNAALLDVQGFPKLRAIDWSLVIRQSAELTHVGGFAALSQLGGGLRISDNPKLELIEGFDALTEVGACADVHVNQESACAGFETLVYDYYITHELYLGAVIELNQALEHIRGFGSLTELEHGVRISGNPALRSFGWPIIHAPMQLVEVYYYYYYDYYLTGYDNTAFVISGSPALDQLALLDTLEVGSLALNGSFSGELVFSSLAAGALWLNDSAQASKLSLPVASELPILVVNYNQALATLEAPQLGAIEWLQISGNPELASLNGLSSVHTVDNLYVTSNHKLPECEALAFAEAVGTLSPSVSGNDTNATCESLTP